MSRYTLQPGMIVPQTPFYYCDIDLLQRTLQTATTEAARYGYQIHYAMKANAEPHILYEIQQAGLGADCVSGYEVECHSPFELGTRNIDWLHEMYDVVWRQLEGKENVEPETEKS